MASLWWQPWGPLPYLAEVRRIYWILQLCTMIKYDYLTPTWMCPHLCLQALLESFLWYSYASLSMLSVRSFSGKSLPNGSIFLPDRDLNIYHFMYKLQQLQRNLACSLQLFFSLPPNILICLSSCITGPNMPKFQCLPFHQLRKEATMHASSN